MASLWMLHLPIGLLGEHLKSLDSKRFLDVNQVLVGAWWMNSQRFGKVSKLTNLFIGDSFKSDDLQSGSAQFDLS